MRENEVSESEVTNLTRCEVCGSERIHVYPSDELVKRRALCLQCGAHYDEISGWLDPEDEYAVLGRLEALSFDS